MPPVSTSSYAVPLCVMMAETRSRVTPGVGSTIESRRPASAFSREDLPTFWRPTMVTTGSLPMRGGIVALRLRRNEMKSKPVTIYVGTRKGAFIYKGDAARKKWALDGPRFLGQVINHIVPDPRDRKVILVAAKPGHLGPSLFRSLDGGKTYKEASKPPAFPKGHADSVKQVFCLSPGVESQPGVWWAGTAPHGIFRSTDDGDTWESVKGFNEHPMRPKWRGEPENSPPDDPNTHSIVLDPRDPNHLYAGFSIGGIFESRDGGADWKPLNQGVAGFS